MLNIVAKAESVTRQETSTTLASKDLHTVFNDKGQPTKKHSNPLKYIENLKDADILKVIFEIFHLKDIYRRGYTLEGRDIPVEKCESNGDHCFGIALLSLILVTEYFPELNLEKVIIMAMLHEIGEVYIGDITPSDMKKMGMTYEDKHDIEKVAVIKILSKLPNGKKYIAIWEEFEEGITPEAQFVKKMDKLEMMIQAAIYRGHYENDGLKEFLDNHAYKMEDDEELKKIVECLYTIFENKT